MIELLLTGVGVAVALLVFDLIWWAGERAEEAYRLRRSQRAHLAAFRKKK